MGCVWPVQGGVLQLIGCSVSSGSGSGLGLEGGRLEARRCSFAGCARHGVALFSDIDGGPGDSLCGTSCGRQTHRMTQHVTHCRLGKYQAAKVAAASNVQHMPAVLKMGEQGVLSWESTQKISRIVSC